MNLSKTNHNQPSQQLSASSRAPEDGYERKTPQSASPQILNRPIEHFFPEVVSIPSNIETISPTPCDEGRPGCLKIPLDQFKPFFKDSSTPLVSESFTFKINEETGPFERSFIKIIEWFKNHRVFFQEAEPDQNKLSHQETLSNFIHTQMQSFLADKEKLLANANLNDSYQLELPEKVLQEAASYIVSAAFTKNIPEKIKLLERARELCKLDKSTLLVLAWSYQELGQIDKTERILLDLAEDLQIEDEPNLMSALSLIIISKTGNEKLSSRIISLLIKKILMKYIENPTKKNSLLESDIISESAGIIPIHQYYYLKCLKELTDQPASPISDIGKKIQKELKNGCDSVRLATFGLDYTNVLLAQDRSKEYAKFKTMPNIYNEAILFYYECYPQDIILTLGDTTLSFHTDFILGKVNYYTAKKNYTEAILELEFTLLFLIFTRPGAQFDKKHTQLIEDLFLMYIGLLLKIRDYESLLHATDFFSALENYIQNFSKEKMSLHRMKQILFETLVEYGKELGLEKNKISYIKSCDLYILAERLLPENNIKERAKLAQIIQTTEEKINAFGKTKVENNSANEGKFEKRKSRKKHLQRQKSSQKQISSQSVKGPKPLSLDFPITELAKPVQKLSSPSLSEETNAGNVRGVHDTPSTHLKIPDTLRQELIHIKGLVRGGAVRDAIMTETFEIGTEGIHTDIDVIVPSTTPTKTLISKGYQQNYFLKKLFQDKLKKIDIFHTNCPNEEPSKLSAQAASDFTINALSASPRTGTVYDPTKLGLFDIKNRILRTTSDADTLFKNDPICMLRAINFAVRFNLKYSSDTSLALNKNQQNLSPSKCSPDNISKISYYLRKLFSTKHAPEIFEALLKAGILKVLFPEFSYALETKHDTILTRLRMTSMPNSNTGKASDGNWSTITFVLLDMILLTTWDPEKIRGFISNNRLIEIFSLKDPLFNATLWRYVGLYERGLG